MILSKVQSTETLEHPTNYCLGTVSTGVTIERVCCRARLELMLSGLSSANADKQFTWWRCFHENAAVELRYAFGPMSQIHNSSGNLETLQCALPPVSTSTKSRPFHG